MSMNKQTTNPILEGAGETWYFDITWPSDLSIHALKTGKQYLYWHIMRKKKGKTPLLPINATLIVNTSKVKGMQTSFNRFFSFFTKCHIHEYIVKNILCILLLTDFALWAIYEGNVSMLLGEIPSVCHLLYKTV